MKKRLYLSIGLMSIFLTGCGQQAAPTVTATPISFQCKAGKTIYEILTASHTTQADNGGTGKLIKVIDGWQPTAKYTWNYYVSGVKQDIGPDRYTCQGGEEVTFQIDAL